MFGYIKPFQPELKVKELDAYKAVYCGLCGQLGKSFGPAARLALSYDFTFLSMLCWSVSGESPRVERQRCWVNPIKKLPVCLSGGPLEFGADVAAIMISYKLADNISDDGFLRAAGWRALKPFTGQAHKKAAAARPECESLIALGIEKQQRLEAEKEPSADAACEPMAAALGGVFRQLSKNTAQQRVLERLGYLIGRYTYLCDALDDMEQDAARGGYNPYVLRYSLVGADKSVWEQAREDAAGALNMTIGEAEKTCALLTLGDFAPIIDNIITRGLRASVDEILSKKENTK